MIPIQDTIVPIGVLGWISIFVGIYTWLSDEAASAFFLGAGASAVLIVVAQFILSHVMWITPS